MQIYKHGINHFVEGTIENLYKAMKSNSTKRWTTFFNSGPVMATENRILRSRFGATIIKLFLTEETILVWYYNSESGIKTHEKEPKMGTTLWSPIVGRKWGPNIRVTQTQRYIQVRVQVHASGLLGRLPCRHYTGSDVDVSLNMTKDGYGSERLYRVGNQLDAGNLIASGTRVDWFVSKRGDNIACLFLQSIY